MIVRQWVTELEPAVAAEGELGVGHAVAGSGDIDDPGAENRAVEVDRSGGVRDDDERGDGRVSVRCAAGSVPAVGGLRGLGRVSVHGSARYDAGGRWA